MRKLTCMTVFLLVLASCKLNDDVSVHLPDQKSFYVVEAILKPGRPMELLFSQSNRMNDIASLSFVWFADACLTINNDTIPLTNYLFLRKDDSVMINYTSNVLLPAWNDGSIRLRLVKDNDTITATSRFVKSVDVKRCTADGLDVDATISNGYDNSERFFMVEAFLYKQNKKVAQYSQVYDKSRSDGAELQLHLRVGDVKRDSLKVVISHISREHYEYLYSCNRAVDAYFDPFTVPVQIKSNIRGGLGIFAVVQEQTVHFNSRYP